MGFGRFGPEKLEVFYRTNWFCSISAKKVGLVDFDCNNLFLTKKRVLVDFDWEK